MKTINQSGQSLGACWGIGTILGGGDRDGQELRAEAGVATELAGSGTHGPPRWSSCPHCC